MGRMGQIIFGGSHEKAALGTSRPFEVVNKTDARHSPAATA
jgi:hypothetical protein